MGKWHVPLRKRDEKREEKTGEGGLRDNIMGERGR